MFKPGTPGTPQRVPTRLGRSRSAAQAAFQRLVGGLLGLVALLFPAGFSWENMAEIRW